MDGGTKREKEQSAGNHKKKRKDQKGKIYDKYGELRKFVRRTTDTSAPHIWPRIEC